MIMRNILTLSALTLALTGGVALADRGGHSTHSGGGHQGGGAVVRDHRGGGGGGHQEHVRFGGDNRGGYNHGYSRGEYNRGGGYYHGGGYVHGGYNRGWARRPIYINHPVVRYHYYNYYQRPSLIVENYDPMPGYYWVPGAWSWDGGEWIWTYGHYEPIE
jgi:hypothetical protein